MRKVRRVWWKVAILAALPLVPLLVIREQRSWMPRTLRATPDTHSPTFPIPKTQFHPIALAWSPDGETLAAAYMISVRNKNNGGYETSASQLQLWDARTRVLSAQWKVPGAICSLAWSPSGKSLATASVNGLPLGTDGVLTLRVWDATSHVQKAQWESKGAVFTPIFLAGTPHLGWQDENVLNLLRAQGSQNAQERNENPYATTCVLERWSTATKERVSREVLGGPVPRGFAEWHASSATLSAKGDSIAVVPCRQERAPQLPLLLYTRTKNGLSKRYLRVSRGSYFSPQLQLSSNGKALALLAGHSQVEVIDVPSAKTLFQIKGQDKPNERNNLLAFALSPDGEQLVTCDSLGAIALWNARTGTRTRILSRHQIVSDMSLMGANLDVENGMAHVQFSPDSSQLAVASDDGTVTLWRVR